MNIEVILKSRRWYISKVKKNNRQLQSSNNFARMQIFLPRLKYSAPMRINIILSTPKPCLKDGTATKTD